MFLLLKHKSAIAQNYRLVRSPLSATKLHPQHETVENLDVLRRDVDILKPEKLDSFCVLAVTHNCWWVLPKMLPYLRHKGLANMWTLLTCAVSENYERSVGLTVLRY